MQPSEMPASDVDDAAMFLLHLRTQRSQAHGLTHELTPKTPEQAYAIQDAMHRFAGWPIGVLKVGCTSVAAQEALGIPHPIAGRVPTEGVFANGASVPQAFLASEPLLECEIALRVDANGEIDAAAPAIELVNSRFIDTTRASGPSIIADNSAGCGVVLGDPVSLEQAGTLDELTMRLTADGDEIASGDAGALMDGPLGSVSWMLGHEASRDRAVPAGTWIITGTCTGLTPTQFGTSYAADFGPLGSVSFDLT